MTTDEKLAKILAIITPLSKKEIWFDKTDDDEGNVDLDSDICVDDYAGGNVDDAYYGGERAGYTQLARDLLKAIK